MSLEIRHKSRVEQEQIPLLTQNVEARLSLLPQTLSHFFADQPEEVAKLLSHGRDRVSEYRKIFTKIARNPQTEEQLIEEIDKVTEQESMEMVQAGEIAMDVLIIGTGPAGVSMASEIRKERPDAKIVMLDERDYRGGQFADNGYDYGLNSPQMAEKLGFAGELSGRNDLGDSAFMQLSDISDDKHPLRKKLVTTLKVDGFVVAPALVDTKMMEIMVTGQKDDPYIVKVFHKQTEKDIILHPKVIVYAGGQGKPKYSVDVTDPDTQEVFQKMGERIHVADTFSEQLVNMSPEEVLKMVEEGTAFIGGRDSANVAMEEIINKLLKIMEPKDIQALPGIDVYGARYIDSDEFEMKIGTDRYDGLKPYIGTFIHPHKEKAQTLFTVKRNKVSVRTKSSHKPYSHIIMVTGYHNTNLEQLVKGNTAYRRYDIAGQGDLHRETIAQRIGHQNIFIVGVAVKEEYKGKIPRFARSIARHTPKVLAAAHHIVGILDNHQNRAQIEFPVFHLRRGNLAA